MDIKAIETIYKGYKFRSRLEARWAVFFDSLGWQWEYEQEGFELPDGSKYLPDFYFPDVHKYGEVKGAEATDEEINKCLELSKKTYISYNQEYNVEVILLQGTPDNKAYRMFTGGEEMCPVIFCGYDEKYYPVYYAYDFDDYFHSHIKAVRDARSARFEFGHNINDNAYDPYDSYDDMVKDEIKRLMDNPNA